MFNGIKTLAYTTGRTIKAHGLGILVGAGIVSSALAIVFAIKSTKKIEQKTEDVNKNILKLQEVIQSENTSPEEKKNAVKECKKNERKKVGIVVKTYLPTICLFTASVACVIGSHKIMKGRLLAAAAAYQTLDSAFEAYRTRVKQELGEELEQKIFNADKENANGVTADGKTAIAEPESFGGKGYTIVLTKDNWPGWSNNVAFMIEELQSAQNQANIELRIRKSLFWKDILNMIGIRNAKDVLTPAQWQASHIVGYMYDPDDTSIDSFVDFGGLFDRYGHKTEKAMDLIRNGCDSITLSFNVDGDILLGGTTKSGQKKRTFIETNTGEVV